MSLQSQSHGVGPATLRCVHVCGLPVQQIVDEGALPRGMVSQQQHHGLRAVGLLRCHAQWGWGHIYRGKDLWGQAQLVP